MLGGSWQITDEPALPGFTDILLRPVSVNFFGAQGLGQSHHHHFTDCRLKMPNYKQTSKIMAPGVLLSRHLPLPTRHPYSFNKMNLPKSEPKFHSLGWEDPHTSC